LPRAFFLSAMLLSCEIVVACLPIFSKYWRLDGLIPPSQTTKRDRESAYQHTCIHDAVKGPRVIKEPLGSLREDVELALFRQISFRSL
jgi:hypothetical protein